MKKYSVIIILSFLFSLSCQKKENVINSNIGNIGLLSSTTLPPDANDEMKRMYKDLRGSQFEVAIINNPNYGQEHSLDILISGKTQVKDKVTIELNSKVFSSRDNGQWWLQDSSLKQFLGTNVHVKIRTGERTVAEKDIYVPKARYVKAIPHDYDGLKRKGITINWNTDELNPTGKVIFFYQLFATDGNVITNTALLLDDNGSFNLDAVLADQNAKKIYFKMVSGNTVSANIKGQKLLFYIQTHDHHEYDIKEEL